MYMYNADAYTYRLLLQYRNCTHNLILKLTCNKLGMFLIPVYRYLILGVLVMPLTCRV